MGHGKDTVSGIKKLEDNYGSTPEGVQALFEQYRQLQHLEIHDWNAVDIRITFEQALTATAMEEDDRLAAALIYGLELSAIQASQLMSVKVSAIKEHTENAREAVEAVLNGYPTKHHATSSSKATTLSGWIQEVREGKTMMFDIPKAVWDSLLTYLVNGKKEDKLAKETLRQQAEGRPLEGENGLNDIMGNFPYDPERYPFYDTSEMIENPNRRGDFKTAKESGYDYFRDSDLRNGVTSDDFTHLSNGLKMVGYKKVKGDGSDNATGGDAHATRSKVWSPL